ncbi:tetratricopeptide repeat protein [Botryobacter ruber]|uniref:tetratricopeptide repeat protein n=1 Tax=Botryobacter ruber TaxID=2171629 RepID=UPI0013E36EDA|nr:tetratricopeptide repeat protein [Botryobacter ruber]
MSRLAKKQKVLVTPNPLTTSGDQVEFELKATVPARLIQEKYAYKLDIYYEYGDQQREDIVTYNFRFGEFIYERGKPTMTRQLAFPYSPKKNNGRLMAQGRIINAKTKEIKHTAPLQVATGIVTTPQAVVRNNTITFIPDNYDAEAKPALLEFFFEQDKAELRNYVGSNLDILNQYILDNADAQHVKVYATQSPDEKDKTLAEDRAKAIEEYYRERLAMLDYTGKKVNIRTRFTRDIRDVLTQKVQRSALPKEQVDELLSIINQETDPDKLDKALQKAEAYNYLQLYIYPSMRAATVEINYQLNRRSDYEIYLLAKRIAQQKVKADELTEDELHYAATLTPLLAEKRELYEAAVKSTNKWPAYYNLGTVYIEMAQKEYRPAVKLALLKKAIHNLTFAGYRNPSSSVFYSLASAYHLSNQKQEALENYKYAIKLGGKEEVLNKIFADKAALEIEMGLYNEAIESLRYAGDNYQTNMNMGLIYMLKENYEGAARYYNRALTHKPEDAHANYSMAVVGARSNNEQMLTEHLRKAVKSDPELIRKAVEDIEFRAWHRKPSFEEALLR